MPTCCVGYESDTIRRSPVADVNRLPRECTDRAEIQPQSDSTCMQVALRLLFEDFNQRYRVRVRGPKGSVLSSV